MDYGAARNRNKRIDKYKPSFLNRNTDQKKGDCRFVSAGYYGSFEQGELKWRLYREYRIRFQAIFKMQVLEKKLGKNYAFLPLSCVKPVIYLDGIEWIVECRRALEILINSWIYLVS